MQSLLLHRVYPFSVATLHTHLSCIEKTLQAADIWLQKISFPPIPLAACTLKHYFALYRALTQLSNSIQPWHQYFQENTVFSSHLQYIDTLPETCLFQSEHLLEHIESLKALTSNLLLQTSVKN